MIKNWQLNKRGYLIRLGHMEARLKKSDIKQPKFTPCRNWHICVGRKKVKWVNRERKSETLCYYLMTENCREMLSYLKKNLRIIFVAFDYVTNFAISTIKSVESYLTLYIIFGLFEWPALVSKTKRVSMWAIADTRWAAGEGKWQSDFQ